MKTDIDLASDVSAELSWDPSLQTKALGVTARNGIVTLSGTVATFAEKLAAEKAVRRIAGVRGIAEKLTVNLVGAHQRSDGELARSVTTGLEGSVQVPQGAVTCVVENGEVTLGGTVDWKFQKDAAYKAVRHLAGVRGIHNQIRFQERSADAGEIHTKVTGALKRLFAEDSAGITVQADNGTVTLLGKVHSWAEHDQAEEAAWSSPGVTAVDNNLSVFD